MVCQEVHKKPRNNTGQGCLLSAWFRLRAQYPRGAQACRLVLILPNITKKGYDVNRNPLFLLVRPARFERATYGFEDQINPFRESQ